MGLRFRKSVTLCKGVRLNFGKTGVSISSGIPGFRRTVHSSGRVTTSVGIPGTGIYYVDTKNPSKKKETKKSGGFFSDLFEGNQNNTASTSVDQSSYSNTSNTPFEDVSTKVVHPVYPIYGETPVAADMDSSFKVAVSQKAPIVESPIVTPDVHQPQAITIPIESLQSQTNIETAAVVEGNNKEEITYETIKAIFEKCDAAVEWVDMLSHLTPTSEEFNADTWTYLHKRAVKVFDGDIDTYLEIISTVNPYDDLLDYAEDFEFGTDDASIMEIEFSIIDANVGNLSKSAFEDYYSALAIRVARDTFAILPVDKTVIHVLYKTKELLTATFDRDTFHELNLVGKDASETVKQFGKSRIG